MRILKTMRTTLDIQDDAMDVARTYAQSRRISLGKAVSELLLREPPSRGIEVVNGLPRLKISDPRVVVTNDDVNRLREELGI